MGGTAVQVLTPPGCQRLPGLQSVLTPPPAAVAAALIPPNVERMPGAAACADMVAIDPERRTITNLVWTLLGPYAATARGLAGPVLDAES
jgi:hypothetical protein